MMPIIEEVNAIHCTCVGNKTPHKMCDGRYRLDDHGVKVELLPKTKEDVQLIIMDGCYCSEGGKKCDAVYLVRTNQAKFVVCVELKGTNVNEGVEQLASTRERNEYKTLLEKVRETIPDARVFERAFLVSYEPLGAKQTTVLTQQWNIRFEWKVTAKGIGKVINLRKSL